jgi:hypothetical protein
MSTTTLLSASEPPDLLTAALAAAARGWHVFPLVPGRKEPALHRFDRCPRTGACVNGHAGWEQRATTDPDRIKAAWSTGRAYNVGIATGPSGLLVIDLDVPDPDDPDDTPPERWRQKGVTDGQAVLAVLAEQAGQPYPGDTLTVATPSGGQHLYFTAPEGVELRNTGGDRGHGLGWKVDTRAHGGYILAPGSIIGTQRYTYRHPQPTPAPLPGWLVDRLKPAPLPMMEPATPVQTATPDRRSRYLEAALRAEIAKVTDAPKGQRNACLYVASKALGQLVAGQALDEDTVVNELFAAAWKHIAVGAFSQSQAMATIRSGLRDGANNPRRVA